MPLRALLHFLITDVISLPEYVQAKLKMTPAWAVFGSLLWDGKPYVWEGSGKEIASVKQLIPFRVAQFREGANNLKKLREKKKSSTMEGLGWIQKVISATGNIAESH